MVSTVLLGLTVSVSPGRLKCTMIFGWLLSCLEYINIITVRMMWKYCLVVNRGWVRVRVRVRVRVPPDVAWKDCIIEYCMSIST
jgi:hypothetical protein